MPIRPPTRFGASRRHQSWAYHQRRSQPFKTGVDPDELRGKRSGGTGLCESGTACHQNQRQDGRDGRPMAVGYNATVGQPIPVRAPSSSKEPAKVVRCKLGNAGGDSGKP